MIYTAFAVIYVRVRIHTKSGLADAAWTAIGLAVGTYLNWLIVSKRLRRYSVRANNSITLPEFFSNRFREKHKHILLIAASAFSKNIFQGIFKKSATDKQVMTVSRITLLALALIGIVIALDENSVIFEIVSFAWAGFGATFGPLMLFSLFWKRINKPGAIAGMVGGAGMIFLWKLVLSQLGGVFGIYELLPAFLFSAICIVVVSLLTKAPAKEIEEDFDAVRAGTPVQEQ